MYLYYYSYIYTTICMFTQFTPLFICLYNYSYVYIIIRMFIPLFIYLHRYSYIYTLLFRYNYYLLEKYK